jgi:hypothetical protein
MSKSVDVVELVDGLAKRRSGRACIVFTHEYSDQAEWARRLAEKTGAEHIDLLDEFSRESELSGSMRTMLIPAFFDFLAERSSAQVMVVSGIEFLKATWSADKDYARQFAGAVETWGRSPALLFVMQYDRKIAQYDFTSRYADNIYVVDRRETIKL